MRRLPSDGLAARLYRSPKARCAVCVVVAITVVGCVAADRDRRTAPRIATARAQAIGSQVMVDGVVTVAPRTFDDGFALQDASGGIYVARALDRGDRARVQGPRLGHARRARQAHHGRADRASDHGTGSAPAPLEVATGDVGPATEGRLIAVRGRVAGAIVDDRPWGSKLYVNDGSGPCWCSSPRRRASTGRDTAPGKSCALSGSAAGSVTTPRCCRGGRATSGPVRCRMWAGRTRPESHVRNSRRRLSNRQNGRDR